MKSRFLWLSALFLLLSVGSFAQAQDRVKNPNMPKHSLKLAMPDLLIKTVGISDNKQRISVVVINVCKGKSKATKVRLAFHQNEDVGRGQILFEMIKDIPALAQDGEYGVEFEISDFAKGKDKFADTEHYYTELRADYEDIFKEVDEYNNNVRPVRIYTAPEPEDGHCTKNQ